jgi:hypothetical protein
LLLALVYRRWPPQAHLLMLFMLGYSAAVSTTYFTPRASALVELCALLLAASALSMVFTQEAHELSKQQLTKRRLHFKPNEPSLRVNAAAFGSGLALALLAGIGYDAWRVQHDLLGPWHTTLAQRQAVYTRALELADGDASAVYGRLDLLPPRAHLPWCLPGPTYTRLWMDDPQVARQVGGLLPELAPQAVLEAGPSFAVRGPRSTMPERSVLAEANSDLWPADGPRVVLLWPAPANPADLALAQRFAAAPESWLPVESPTAFARLWVRTPTPEAPATAPAQPTSATVP